MLHVTLRHHSRCLAGVGLRDQSDTRADEEDMVLRCPGALNEHLPRRSEVHIAIGRSIIDNLYIYIALISSVRTVLLYLDI